MLQVDKYLSATGYLPPHVKPFFVALPKDRAIQSSAEWRRAMAEVDAHIYRYRRQAITLQNAHVWHDAAAPAA